MIDTDSVARDLFNKIRSRFQRVSLGTERAKKTVDPEKARFFNFDFDVDGIKYSVVTINVNEDQSLLVYYDRSLDSKMPDDVKQVWYKFLRGLRRFAKRRLFSYDVRDINKAGLELRDLHHIRQDDDVIQGNDIVKEGRMYGTSRSSYENIGPVRIVVRHSDRVQEDILGARSRNISSIYVENQLGERFRLPEGTTVSEARAFARHIKNGGNMHDEFSEHITSMITEMHNLRKFVRNMRGRTFEDVETNSMVEAAINYYGGLHRDLHRLKGQRGYENYLENWRPGENILTDDIDLQELRGRFERRVFDERLMDSLPIVARAYQKHRTQMEQDFNSWAGEVLGEFQDMPRVLPADSEDDLAEDHDDDDDESQAHRDHQKKRKKSGLPDPDYYKKLSKLQRREEDGDIDYDEFKKLRNELRQEYDLDPLKENIIDIEEAYVGSLDKQTVKINKLPTIQQRIKEQLSINEYQNPDNPGRRNFLRGVGATAAGMALGSQAHADEKPDPNKLIARVVIAGEVKDFDLTGMFKGNTRQQVDQAYEFITNKLKANGINFYDIEVHYQGARLLINNVGSVKEHRSATLDSKTNLNEFAPSDGGDRGISWTQLVNYLLRTLKSFGFSFEGSENFAEYNRGNESLRIAYDPNKPGSFGWALGRYARDFDVLSRGTDPITIDSADQVLEYVNKVFGYKPKDMTEDSEEVGEFDSRINDGWVMSQGLAEGLTRFKVGDKIKFQLLKDVDGIVDKIDDKRLYVKIDNGDVYTIPSTILTRFKVGDKIEFKLPQKATGIVDKIDDKRLKVKLDNGDVHTIPSTNLHSVELLKRQGLAKGDQGISKKQETKFHAKLDKLVHDTFGRRKDEMEESLKTENPCWRGYKPVGTKKKNGKTVPNCVPRESQEPKGSLLNELFGYTGPATVRENQDTGIENSLDSAPVAQSGVSSGGRYGRLFADNDISSTYLNGVYYLNARSEVSRARDLIAHAALESGQAPRYPKFKLSSQASKSGDSGNSPISGK
jgi:hypothetical protein